jgi:hypothetical protein
LRIRIENVGKQPLEQSGKYRVNENDEEIFRGVRIFPRIDTGFQSHYGLSNRTIKPSFQGDAKHRTRNLEIPGSR